MWRELRTNNFALTAVLLLDLSVCVYIYICVCVSEYRTAIENLHEAVANKKVGSVQMKARVFNAALMSYSFRACFIIC